MASSILRFTCGKAAAGISRRNICGGDGRKMSTTTTRISPWLMLPPASEDGGGGGGAHKFYNLAQHKVMSFKKKPPPPPSADGRVKLVGTSHNWVASFNFDNKNIFLSDPINGRHMELPNLHTLPEMLFDPSFPMTVDKIILSSSPDADECRAAMICGADCRRAVMICCPGRSSKWVPLDDVEYFDYEAYHQDLVYSSSQKRLFCLTRDDELECWDLADHKSSTIVWKDLSHNKLKLKLEGKTKTSDSRYLVEHERSDRLFLVTRHVSRRDGLPFETYYSYPYNTYGFDVHEIDRNGGKIRYMDGSLDGLAMFVGINHSLALPAAEFPELKSDSIYFTGDERFTPLDDDCADSYGGHDNGVFNYVHGKLSSTCYSCHASNITRMAPAPMWFTPTF